MEKKKLDDWFEKLIAADENKKKILSNNDYINWIIDFIKIHGDFSDEDWLYSEENLSEGDEENVKNLSLFFDVINEYAERNYIYPTSTRFNVTYCIKYNDYGLEVGISPGQGCICYCNKVEIDDESTFIDFNDVLTNKKQPQVDYIEGELHHVSQSIINAHQNGVPLVAIEKAVRNTINSLKEQEVVDPKILCRQNPNE